MRITTKDGETRDRTARYIDEYHVELSSGSVSNLFHICEFAERIEKSGSSVIPLRASLPQQCYSILDETGEIILIKKGEHGYYQTDISTADPEANRRMVDASNGRYGVTKAQESAMKAGSLFGWEVPTANPDNYSTDGSPISARGKAKSPGTR